jgi:uncharacterized protein (TIRG00374 family)
MHTLERPRLSIQPPPRDELRRDAHGRQLVRRPADAVALLAAVGVLVYLAWRSGTVTAVDEGVAQLVGALPDGLHGLFEGLYRVGSLWLVLIVAGIAVWRRSIALATTVTLSGVGAWLLGKALVVAVDSDAVLAGVSSAFPLVRMAVVTAVVTAAIPYVSRPYRILGGCAALGVAVAAVYLSSGLPLDVVGGAVLGYAVAKLVLVAVGAPAHRPTTEQVHTALDGLGVDVVDVVEADSPWTLAAEMNATAVDGSRLWIRVLGRDQRDLNIVAKTWRWLVQKDYEPNFFVTRVADVEHEAYVTMLAQRAGVLVPDVVTAGAAGEGAAVLVEKLPDGRPLNTLAPEELTDSLLDEVWRGLAGLQAAGIAHGALSSDRFVVRDDGRVWVTDFSVATAAAPADRRHRDIADLLATSAVLVGPDRAVDAAVRAVGPDGLRDALPYVQAVVISVPTRRAIPRRSKLLDQVRSVGAARLGEKAPDLEPLRRITWKNIVTVVGTFIGVNALLAQVGSLSDIGSALSDANWWWVLAGFGVSLLTYPAAAAGLMASLPNRMPFARVAELQLASKFTNLMAPADMGSQAMTIRFLQVQGVDGAAAVTSSVATTILGAIGDLALVLLCVWAGGLSLSTGGLPDGLGRTVLIVLLVAAVVAAIVYRVPKWRTKAQPHVQQARATIKGLVTSPRRSLTIVLSSFAMSLFFALCLGACLLAYGVHLPIATLVVVNWTASTVANMTPVPGGMGVAEAGLIAGLTAAGVPTDQAVAAALTHRLLTFWIPPIAGWFAMRDLTKQHYI